MTEAHPLTPEPHLSEELQMSESLRRLNAVHEISEDLLQRSPNFAGITVYGSTVRGQSANRDVDMYAFFEAPTEQTPTGTQDPAPRAEKVIDGAMNVYQFDFNTNFAHKTTLLRALREKGVEEADIDVLAISPDIVADQVADLTERAALNDELIETIKDKELLDQQFKVYVPRNIRALFQMPVGQDRLRRYQSQVVNALAASPHGKMAWAMLWYRATHFEEGRDHHYRGDHRRTAIQAIPDTLERAVEMYGDADA